MLKDAAARLDEFRGGIEKGDLALLRRVAHTLKSSSANLGARRFAQFCAEVETAARLGAFAQVASHQSELETRTHRMLRELSEYRDRPRA